MVFIDQMNFQAAVSDHYASQSLPSPRLDYNLLPQVVCSNVPNSVLVKTFLCAPKPDAFLMTDSNLEKYYKWLTGLKNQKNFDVIEGEHVARPTTSKPMIITDKSTYYKVEKGTDINIAVESITKAYNNAYDVAIFMSGDADYLPIYKILRTIGKLVVVAVVKGQYIGKIIPHVDNYIRIDTTMFSRMLRS